MKNKDILRHIDHTALKAITTLEDIIKLCEEAIKLETASVCIPPYYVKKASELYGEKLSICTVIGFPLGYNTKEAKTAEAKCAVLDGADELDMVVNLCDVKNGDFDAVTEEISALKAIAGKKILKVIVETCYLTETEKIKLCECVTKGGADYIKTSTGFGSKGAQLEDIALFKKHIGGNVKIKAAGGIRTREDMEKFLEAGCERIGSSSAVKALETKESGE